MGSNELAVSILVEEVVLKDGGNTVLVRYVVKTDSGDARCETRVPIAAFQSASSAVWSEAVKGLFSRLSDACKEVYQQAKQSS